MSDMENVDMPRLCLARHHQPTELARIGYGEGQFMHMQIAEPATALRIHANGMIELDGEMVNDEPQKVVEFLQQFGRLVVPTIG